MHPTGEGERMGNGFAGGRMALRGGVDGGMEGTTSSALSGHLPLKGKALAGGATLLL